MSCRFLKFLHYVFEVRESFADIPTELPCLGDLENSGHLPVQEVFEQTIGHRGFFHASPAIWNSLPDDLRDPELSTGCFRNKLKTFFFPKFDAF